MTAKERVLKTLNFEKTDTIPVYDIINNKAIYERILGIKDLAQHDDITGAAVKVYSDMGIDCTRGFYNPMWQYSLVENWIKYLKVPAQGWILSHDSDTSWVLKTPYETLEDLEKYMPCVPEKQTIRADFVESYTQTRDRFAPHLEFWASIGGFLDQAYRFLGFELFSMGLYDAPELIDQLIEVFFQTQKIYMELYAEFEMSNSLVYCDDLAFKSSTLFSPSFFEEHYFERLKRLFAPVIEKNINIIFHSDGFLYPILDGIVASGIKALNPLEIMAGMDIVEVRKRYPKLGLVGGVDCSQLLPFGSFSDIRKEVERIVNAIGRDGGIILGSTTEIHSAISYENCKCMVDAIKEFGAKI